MALTSRCGPGNVRLAGAKRSVPRVPSSHLRGTLRFAPAARRPAGQCIRSASGLQPPSRPEPALRRGVVRIEWARLVARPGRQKGWGVRTGYFDCFSGISGDMTLAALVDAGVDREAIRSAVASLGLD